MRVRTLGLMIPMASEHEIVIMKGGDGGANDTLFSLLCNPYCSITSMGDGRCCNINLNCSSDFIFESYERELKKKRREFLLC